MKCAIYLRTSTLEQHPEKQKDECVQLAEARGYEVVNVFHEQLSGYKQIERPIYEDIKKLAHKGEINAVIVWSLDRWVRNRDTLLDDITSLKSYGCKLHSVKEQWLEAVKVDGSLGKTIQEFLLGLIGSLGEMESQRKSERVKMAHQNHKGKKWGRPKVEVNVFKVWNLKNQGLSIRKIASELMLSKSKVESVLKTTLENGNILYKEN